jgi:beta-glucosidase
MKKIFLCLFISCALGLTAYPQQGYLNPSLPLDARIKDLVSRLTLEEKISQLGYNSPSIARLNIPAYNWWNEALHGVGRSGTATIFPQAIGLAATFDEALAKQEATAISDEARAMFNAAIKKGYHMQYGGLTFWTPNINIFRDPRWGRGQETFGEDPFLTSVIGVAFVKGLQGDHPKYLKTAACAKHYAVHSGPEKLRHEFNAVASMKDLWDTYLPAFKALVDAKVEAVMCAYNRTNDEPCCSNTYLLQDVLRDKWQFKGHVVTDCWALSDYINGHKIVSTNAEASAMAIKKGVNLECGNSFPGLNDAVKQGLVTEKEIDGALSVLLRTRFKLGLFDPASANPYNKLPPTIVNSAKHRQLARTAAQKSVVLLKNNGVLPLKDDLKKYFVTGPNATSIEALIGNYYGTNDNLVTILEGLSAQIKTGSQLQYRQGILLDRPNAGTIDWTTGNAKNADATIVVLGISGLMEGEEGESIASPYFGDRLDYNLPAHQLQFLRKLKENNKQPVIAVVTGGCPMNLSEVHDIADAVLMAWYPGEEGGNAIADIIFGKVSPSGRLPITFPKSLDQLPAYEDYSMKGRTYRYMTAEPMYPFGFGLSYTDFAYTNLKTSNLPAGNVEVEVKVSNTGKFKGEEVVQLYITHENKEDAPLYALKGFKRMLLSPGTSATTKFILTREMLSIVNEKGETEYASGRIRINVGGSLPGKRSKELGAAANVETTVIF